MMMFRVPATPVARPSLPRRPDAVPLSPAAYLGLRRTAAGLTQHDVARHMATTYHQLAQRRPPARLLDTAKQMLLIVRALELPHAVARRGVTIDVLSAAMPFNRAVYWQLARDPADRHPRVCRGCGVSTHDRDMPRWATSSSCTRCDPLEHGL